jgi:hypothetical protein
MGVLPTDRLGVAEFMAVLFFLGVFGGNFAIFSLWLPELFGTEARATAFAPLHRRRGEFRPAGAVAAMGTLGTPIAITSIAFSRLIALGKSFGRTYGSVGIVAATEVVSGVGGSEVADGVGRLI